MAIRFAPSAWRHGIDVARATHVIHNCADPIYPGPSTPGEPDRILFLGPGDVVARTVITKSGRTLTEADVERLADEAERGYDLSTWVHRRGRPPLEAGLDEPSPRIAVRVPASLHRRVMSQAAAEGRSVSEVVRDLLEAYVEPRPVVSTRRRPT